MKKRLGTFISALLFCLLCLPGVCLAAEFTVENLKYQTTGENTVEVTGMVTPLSEPGKLVIPATVTSNGKQYTVTAIGGSAFYAANSFSVNNTIKSVELPNTITTIGSAAFSQCANLKSIEIPAGVQTLNSSVFKNCTALETVTLNEGLKEIGQETFYGCTALTEINLPNSLQTIVRWSFIKAGLTKLTCPENLNTIQSGAFNNCTNLKDITLNENLQTIESTVFEHCGFSEITVPASTNVDPSAFNSCTGTIKVHTTQLYAALVNNKEKYHFTYTVQLLGSLQNIEFDDGDYHFIIIDADNKEVQLTGMSAAYKQANGNTKPSGALTIPDQASGYGNSYTVTSIGVSAFNGCAGLAEVNLPESLTNISQDSFRECYGLSRIELPNNIKTIDSTAFVSCKNLSEIKWPANLESIGDGAFQTCPITTLQLPDTLQQIGDGAFYNCQELQNVILPDNLQSIGEQAFEYCAKLEAVSLPTGLKEMGTSVFAFCPNLKTVTFPANINLTKLPNSAFASCTSLENIELPASIKTIGTEAFSTCTSLQSVTLPENLEVLEQGAFFNCTSLSGKLQLPESLTNIGYRTFKGCTGLERIYITGSNLQNVSAEAFAGVPLVTCDSEEMLEWLTDRAGDGTKIRLQNYPISVSSEPAKGGSATASASIAAIGDRITLTATPNEGWLFEKWQPEELEITNNGFTMPDYAVNIQAIFKEEEKPTPPDPEEPIKPVDPQPSVYIINYDTDGGTLVGAPNPDSATSGQEYKMPAANKSGNTLKHWAIGGKTSNITANPGDVYTFTADTWVYAIWQPDNTNQPSGGGGGHRPSQTKPTETVKPTEPTQPGKPNAGNADNISSIFQDLQPGAWYSEAIAYVYAQGLMQGVAESEFAPNANLSRAMLAQIIYNMAGQPETTSNGSFADVADNAWYSKAISWANAQGVVTGYSLTEFAPNAEITREQLIVMLWRYAGQPAANRQQADFPDWQQSSAYARQALCWAAENGLIKGHTDGTLRPQAPATRAEAAQVLQNFLIKISK